MRPVDKKYKMHFGFGELYPENLRYLTSDGRHHGFDYLTWRGIPVIACVNGILYDKGYFRGYGNAVWIKFWTGMLWNRKTYRIILAHLDEITTTKKIGDKIGKEEIVGLSGDSGMAVNHPHLHLEAQELTNGVWNPTNPTFVAGAA